jgi:hypothetical protein
MPTGKMSQADFIKQLRAQAPELKDFSDDEIMKKVIERKPDILGQVETSQDMFNRQKGHIVDPAWWEDHPTLKALTQGTTGTFPAIGAVAGGILATPETYGTGTLAGFGFGGAAGQGLRDIANQGLGLDNTSISKKVLNMGKEGLLAAMTPGGAETAAHPIDTARGIAGVGANVIEGIVGKRFQPWLGKWLDPEFLRSIEQGGAKDSGGMGTLNRPAWQSGPYSVQDMGNVPPRPGVSPTWAEGQFTEAPTDMTVSRPFRTPSPPTGLQTTPGRPNMSIEQPPRLTGSPGRTGPDILGTPRQIERGDFTGPDTLGGQRQIPESFPNSPEPIIYSSQSKPGYIKGSLDGGKTWKYSTDYGDTWSQVEPK